VAAQGAGNLRGVCGSEQQIKQFLPLVQAVALAANGDKDARTFVEGEYSQDGGRGKRVAKAAEAIRKLIAGDRNVDVFD